MPSSQNNLTTIYLVRHGETHANVDKIIDGQSVNAPLNANGETQAATLAAHLEDVQFDAAFSSDLLRAKRTAEVVVMQKQLALNTTELLRERNFAHQEGITYDMFEASNKDILAKLQTLSLEEYLKTPLSAGVETSAEMFMRFQVFLREVAVTYARQTVLVVSHGGMLNTVLQHIGWADHINLPHYAVENTAYAVIKTDGVEFEVAQTKGINKIENV